MHSLNVTANAFAQKGREKKAKNMISCKTPGSFEWDFSPGLVNKLKAFTVL